MELVNQTPLGAELVLSDVAPEQPGTRNRMGSLLAKATFIVRNGVCHLDDDVPLPVLAMDEPTELGLLPQDVAARLHGGADLILLGAAYGPRGAPTAEVRVRLQVGETYRELVATGDRVWLGAGPEARISEPVPFTRMPLTWERTYGGSGEVWIDAHTPLEVRHALNPLGRGLDVAREAERLRTGWGCPPGFPRFDEVRPLPNLEHPAHRMARFDEEPIPYCWGTIPPGVAPATSVEALREQADASRALRKGHPDWQLPSLSLPLPVRLAGCRPDGDWAFVLPRLDVAADYVRGSARGTASLRPFQVVLLPEQERVTVTFGFWFRTSPDPHEERSFRLTAS